MADIRLITTNGGGDGGITWNVVTSGTTTFAKANAYVAASASQLTFTLPSTAAVGDTYQLVNNAQGSGGWTVTQNSGQSIIVGNETTTTGTGGSITSFDAQGDWIEIVCDTTNTNFVCNIKQGQVTVV